jgi:hypothetical protein
MTRAVVLALAIALAVNRPLAANDESRVTNASNVRLRIGPSTDAAVLAQLPLGTELVVLDHTGAGAWYRVKTADGRDGWVLGGLTTTLAPGRRSQILESIAAGRLASGGNFIASVQLFDFIERTAAGLADPEAQARFAFYRLQSMRHLLLQIPFQTKDAEHLDWIRAHQDAAIYNEPAGTWMVAPKYVQMIHGRYRESLVADDIAWFYVTNGWPGECEGNVPCYVRWQNELNGWYLASYPPGRHADESNAAIALSLNGVMDNLLKFPRVLAEFDPKTGCDELHMSLDPLAAAVQATTTARKTDALAAIERYANLCR